jgi:uncharacterized lipoprotein NlpE involved in copper resistance
MKKLVFTALCVASVLALPGCGSKEEQKPAEVKQEVPAEAAKPAEQAPEAAQPAAEQAPEAAKPEEVPAK